MKQILYSAHASSIFKAVLLARVEDGAVLKNKAAENYGLFDYPQIDIDKIASAEIYNRFRNHFGEITWLKDPNFSFFKRQINLIFRHANDDRDFLIEKAIQESLDYKLQFVLAKASENSRKFFKYYHSVAADIHANKGFCRLQPFKPQFLVGKIHTEHNTGDIILNFFTYRFPRHKIALIDKKKNLAFVYNLKSVFVTSPENLGKELEQIDSRDIYTQYWQTYYETQYIPEKKNLELALKNFPQKRWHDMFEADFLKKHLEE